MNGRIPFFHIPGSTSSASCYTTWIQAANQFVRHSTPIIGLDPDDDDVGSMSILRRTDARSDDEQTDQQDPPEFVHDMPDMPGSERDMR